MRKTEAAMLDLAIDFLWQVGNHEDAAMSDLYYKMARDLVTQVLYRIDT